MSSSRMNVATDTPRWRLKAARGVIPAGSGAQHLLVGCDLGAAQPGDPTRPPADRKTHLLRRDPPTARDQELSYLSAVVHASTYEPSSTNWEMPPAPPHPTMTAQTKRPDLPAISASHRRQSAPLHYRISSWRNIVTSTATGSRSRQPAAR